MLPLRYIRDEFRRFLRDETGLITAESVISMPFLVWWYVGSLVFFDAYKARNVNLKAAFTISDMISREDGEVNAAYIEGLADIFDYLITGHGHSASVRITLVRCTENCDGQSGVRTLDLDWSYATGSKSDLVAADMPDYLEVIPIMPTGDRVILLETFVKYDPAWEIGVTNDTDFNNIVVTRPRFVPQLPFDDGT